MTALRTLGTGTFFFCFFATINACVVEPSDPGGLVKRMAYDWQQLRLAVMRRAPTELAVVDIGSLPACPERGPRGVIFPRAALIEAIEAVLRHRPAAIGIDIDFAPGPNVSCEHTDVGTPYGEPEPFSRWDWTARGGPPLFAQLLKKPTPIYVGVFRTQDFPPAQWLGAEEYAPLAAGLLMPPEPDDPKASAHADAEHEQAELVPGQRRYISRAIGTSEGRLPSLSEALYRHRQEREPSLRARLAGLLPHAVRDELFEATRVQRLDDVEVEEFLVDFSAHQTLRNKTATFVNHTLVLPHGLHLERKLVLLGHTDVKSARDKFPLPGTNRQEAGVYWHAAGADTLIRGVLVQPTRHGREFLDALFYFPWLVVIVALQLRSPHVNVHGLQSLLSKVAAAGVLVLGLVLVHFTRLMWDDFIVIAVLLAAHPTLEHWTLAAFRWIRLGMKSVWQQTTAQE